MSITTPEFSTPQPEGAANVEADLRSLSQDVDSLKQQLARNGHGPAYAAVREAIDTVLRMSQDVFGSVPNIEEVRDCDDPSDHAIVVNLDDSGNLEAMVGRFNTWHSRLSEVPADVRGLFRLSINPKE